MIRCAVGLIICLGCLVTSGCETLSGIGTIHPLSEVTLPTFCLYAGKSEPAPIKEIRVYQYQEVLEGQFKLPLLVWVLEYAPDSSQKRSKPFSCITYGKVLPGYKEKAPALPLTPERRYYVTLWRSGASQPTEMDFRIRLSPRGIPVKLEYHPPGVRGVQVITGR